MVHLLAVLALCLHALLALAAGEQVPIPGLKARVTDLTASLAPAQAAELETRLAAFEARKGSQVVVLVLPTTQPESIEQFGIRLMDAWKIGRKGTDDGVILIVAKNDRRLRIEVGYGLEGVLNDATAKRIIDETITPRFKAGDLPGGITAGVDAILAVVDRENLPAPGASASASSAEGLPLGGVLSLDSVGENTFLFGLGAAAVGGAVLRYFLGTLLGSGLVGLLAAGLGWLFTGTLTGVLIGGIAGFLVALFGLELVLSGIGSSGSGGGSGGGGFSGGGGSGGGGGASGSW
mgnify:CR=1 FL=1